MSSRLFSTSSSSSSSSAFAFSFLILVIVHLGQAESCGGILEGDSGKFELTSREDHQQPQQVCVWLVQIFEGNSIAFTLDSVENSGTQLNLYAELNSNNEFPPAIKLTASDAASSREISGKTVAVLLGKSSGPRGFSFSWKSNAGASSDDSKKKSLVNQITANEGQMIWDKFPAGQTTSVWLNLNLVHSHSDSMTLSVKTNFRRCSTPSMCSCNTFLLFEITADGLLEEVGRVCGRFNANSVSKNLRGQVMTFVRVSTPEDGAAADSDGSNILELKWEAEKNSAGGAAAAAAAAPSAPAVSSPSEPVAPAGETETHPHEKTNGESESGSEAGAGSKSESESEPETAHEEKSEAEAGHDGNGRAAAVETETTEAPISNTIPEAHLTSTSTMTSTLTCPEYEMISPCSCFPEPGGLDVKGWGSDVTQENINHLFTKLREVNSLPPNAPLNLYKLAVGSTELETLDLSPLLNVKLNILEIDSNPRLSTIFLPPLPPGQSERAIHTDELVIARTPLDDHELGDALKFFDTTIKKLTLIEVKVHGGQSRHTIDNKIDGPLEFLPGLSVFRDLTSLAIVNSSIVHVGGGQFKGHPKLETMDLHANNLSSLGEDAFDFGFGVDEAIDDSLPSSSTSDPNLPLTIRLSSNWFNSDGFHNLEQTGLVTSRRPIHLNLGYNQIEQVTAADFRDFLQAHKNNRLDLQGNPLICNERLRWLRDFPGQVSHAECSNDPGKSVFDSRRVLEEGD